MWESVSCQHSSEAGAREDQEVPQVGHHDSDGGGGVKAKLKFRKKKYYRNGRGGEEGDLRVKEKYSLLNTTRMPAWKHESHQFFIQE